MLNIWECLPRPCLSSDFDELSVSVPSDSLTKANLLITMTTTSHRINDPLGSFFRAQRSKRTSLDVRMFHVFHVSKSFSGMGRSPDRNSPEYYTCTRTCNPRSVYTFSSDGGPQVLSSLTDKSFVKHCSLHMKTCISLTITLSRRRASHLVNLVYSSPGCCIWLVFQVPKSS